ncbi:WD40 repeat domain-containing protein [Kitasatospora viridis]|uniref:WD40 repeat protein n=1 Tax=Kitasatospora viridis TaxID=281105 RepID=A0A561T783_9ACTN|nr:hypothetical protein [Kitasatospora viridis]TWF82962.1 WD40 repeat protein [Kitasatospora viridis]
MEHELTSERWQAAWVTGRVVDRRTREVRPGRGGLGPELAVLDGRLLLVEQEFHGRISVGEPGGSRPALGIEAGPDARVVTVLTAAGRALLLTGHQDRHSPDGPGDTSDQLRAWDLRSGEPVGEPLEVPKGRITTAAAAERDGRTLLVTGGWDGLVRVWDLADGQLVAPPVGGHAGWVVALAVAMVAGRQVVLSAGEDDREVLVRDLITGQPAGPALVGHTAPVQTLAAGGGVVATAGQDGTVRIWDPATGRQLGEPLTGAGGPATGSFHRVGALVLARSGGRELVAAGGAGRRVWVWDLATREPLAEPFAGHEQPVEQLALLDGAVAARGFDGSVRVWGFDGPRHEGSADPGLDGSVSALLVLADGPDRLAVAGTHHGSVHAWDVEHPPSGARRLPGHEGSVSALAGAELDGRPVLLTGGSDGVVRVTDPRTGESRALATGTDGVSALTTAEQDGRTLVLAGAADGLVRIWDLATGEPRAPLATGERRVLALAAAVADGRTVLLTGHSDHRARRWDLAARKPLGGPLEGHRRWVDRAATAVVDGRPVVVTGAGYDSWMRVWDLGAGRDLGLGLRGHLRRLGDLATTELGGRWVVVSGGDDRTLRLWDLATQEEDGEPLRLPYRVGALAPVPGRGVLVAFGEELALLTHRR